MQWISRLIFLIMSTLSPLWQKWCYSVKQKLSFIKLSGLYKSKSHYVLAHKPVCTNVTAKSHAGGPQAGPRQFSATSWRNFTVCFCSVCQQEERTWVQFSLAVGIPRTGICRAELYKQQPHLHRTFWLKMLCFMCYPSISFSLKLWHDILRESRWKAVSQRSSCLATSTSFHPVLTLPERWRARTGRLLLKFQSHICLRQACAGP